MQCVLASLKKDRAFIKQIILLHSPTCGYFPSLWLTLHVSTVWPVAGSWHILDAKESMPAGKRRFSAFKCWNFHLKRLKNTEVMIIWKWAIFRLLIVVFSRKGELFPLLRRREVEEENFCLLFFISFRQFFYSSFSLCTSEEKYTWASVNYVS